LSIFPLDLRAKASVTVIRKQGVKIKQPNVNHLRKPDNAMEAHAQKHAEIQALLTRIQQHYDAPSPPSPTWAAVGDLAYSAEKLRQLSDRIFGEGEYAE